MITFAIVSLEVWHTDFPVYVFVIGLTMAFIVTIPIGIIQAVSNQQVSLNVVSETIVGYWVPGKPLVSRLISSNTLISLHSPRSSPLDHDALQSLRVHHHGTGFDVRIRSQARPLYEGPASYFVLGTDIGHRHSRNCPVGCSSVDVHQHS